MNAHPCPAPGCTATVPRSQLACRQHWYLIPQDLRDELWRAYRDDGMWSDPHLDAINACCSWLEEHLAA